MSMLTGHRRVRNYTIYAVIFLVTHFSLHLTPADYGVNSNRVSKERLLIKFKGFYGSAKRPLQIIMPLKKRHQSVGMLLKRINERVRSRYNIRVVELQLNGGSLYEQDIVVDLINPEKAENLFVIEAIWTPIQIGSDQITKKTIKTRSTMSIENTCERWKGCPNCTKHKNCVWCSSVNKCLEKKHGHLCPIQLPSKHCLDFNLKQERKTFLRPCRRWSRWNAPFYGGVCCGDGKCNEKHEDENNCPQDCTNISSSKSEKVWPSGLPPKITEEVHIKNDIVRGVFGKALKPLVRDTYHCEETYEFGSSSPCSGSAKHIRNRPSHWLSSILSRAMQNTLPFKFPLPSSTKLVVELGSGLGQDTRNLAKSGYNKIIGVEVSKTAVRQARAFTPSKTFGNKIAYVAYDALALPKPRKDFKIDLLLDFTVYCGLRHRYLSRIYSLWSKLMTPNHTILMLQCWKSTTNAPVPVRIEDIFLDVEPMLSVLHYESCQKNQMLGGEDGAWCIYLQRTGTVDSERLVAKNRLVLHETKTFDNPTFLRDIVLRGKDTFQRINIWSHVFRMAITLFYSINDGFSAAKRFLVEFINQDLGVDYNFVKTELIKLMLHEAMALETKKDSRSVGVRKVRKELEKHLFKLSLEDDQDWQPEYTDFLQHDLLTQYE